MMNLLHGPLAYHHHDGSSSSSGSSPSSGSSGSSSSSPSSSSNATGESDTSKEFDESDESDKSDESDESDGDIYNGLEYGENYSVNAGVGSSIGGIKEASSVMIYIVAAMLATVIGAAMVVVWVRSSQSLQSFYRVFLTSVISLDFTLCPLCFFKYANVQKRRKERETAQLLGASSAFIEIGSVRNSIAYKPPSNTVAILASEC